MDQAERKRRLRQQIQMLERLEISVIRTVARHRHIQKLDRSLRSLENAIGHLDTEREAAGLD